MIQILQKILEFLKEPKTQRNILAIALIAVIIFFRGCSKNDIDVFKYEQNISALQDTIRTYETKNGDLVHEKLAYIANEKELSKYNQDLKDEVKHLKDNPLVVTKYVTKIVHDTVWIKPEIDVNNISFSEDSSIRIIPFTWADSTIHNNDNYRYLSGSYIIEVDTGLNVSTKEFGILADEIGLSFTTGLTENSNDQVEIFIKSDYPGFVPTSIEGALFDPRDSDVIKKFFPPKRWAIGLYGGYGFYFDPQKVTLGSGVQIGIGLQYNILQWNFKK